MLKLRVRIIFLGLIFLGCACGFAGTDKVSSPVEQSIHNFTVSGFNDENGSQWKMYGVTARIKDSLLEVDKVYVEGICQGVKVNVASDKGYYNQDKGIVLLTKNVKAVSSTGAELTTDSAVWNTQDNVLETDSPVVITQDDKDARLEGRGGKVELDKNLAIIKKDVKAEMLRADVVDTNTSTATKKHKTFIRCKGPLEVKYKDKIAIFHNKVVVEDEEAKIYADKLTVYFDNDENRITKIVAEGHVKIVKDDNVTQSRKAVYDVEKQSLTMIGEPKVLFYTGEEIGRASFGNEKFD